MTTRARGFYLSAVILLCISACMAKSTVVAGEALLSGAGQKEEGQEAYWRALENLDFGLMQNTALPPVFRKFAEALAAVTRGDMDEAENGFKDLLVSSQDARLRSQALDILHSLWFFQSQWKNILEAGTDQPEDKGDGNRNLIMAFGRSGQETYRFPDASCVLPCQWSSTGSPIVEVMVNGTKKKFWIDTGAGLSVIASDVAEACRVMPIGYGTGEAGTATSKRISVQPAVIQELKIGGIVIANHPVIIIDKKDLELKVLGIFRVMKIEGLIGWNAIQHLDLEIDYQKNTTTIRQPRKTNDAERNFFWLGYPVVSLTDQSGVKLHFGLDTGARRTSISENFLAKVQVDNIKTKKKTIGSAGGFERIVSTVIPGLTLKIGKSAVKLQEVGTTPQKGAVFIKLDGTLGCDAWRRGRIRIDWTNGLFGLEGPSR
jgi:predicted aspartyl protease